MNQFLEHQLSVCKNYLHGKNCEQTQFISDKLVIETF